jgi:hypothetical protein
MVKNSLFNGTHSLRGSQSTLSLCQTATTNSATDVKLESARQKIASLEAALERANKAKDERLGIMESANATIAELEQKIEDLKQERRNERAGAISALTNAELETAEKKIQALEEEMGRMEIEKQNELERLEVEKYNEVKRLEAEKAREVKRVEEEKGREVKELKRLEGEKYNEVKRLEREVTRVEEEKREELKRMEQRYKGIVKKGSAKEEEMNALKLDDPYLGYAGAYEDIHTKNAERMKDVQRLAAVEKARETRFGSTTNTELLTADEKARIERLTMEKLRDVEKMDHEKHKEKRTTMQEKMEAFHRERKEARGEVQVFPRAPPYPKGVVGQGFGISNDAHLYPRAHPPPPPPTGHQPSSTLHPLDPSSLYIMGSPSAAPSVLDASFSPPSVLPPVSSLGKSSYPSLAPYDPAWRPCEPLTSYPTYRPRQTVNPGGPMIRAEVKDGMNYKKSDGSMMTSIFPLPVSPPAQEQRKSMSLFERYEQDIQQGRGNGNSLITKALSMEKLQKEKIDNTLKSPEAYTQPFCDFLTENPTVWHAVSYFEGKLDKAGFKKVYFPMTT